MYVYTGACCYSTSGEPGVEVPHRLVQPLYQEVIIAEVSLEVHIIFQQAYHCLSMGAAVGPDFGTIFLNCRIKTKIVRNEERCGFGWVHRSSDKYNTPAACKSLLGVHSRIESSVHNNTQ